MFNLFFNFYGYIYIHTKGKVADDGLKREILLDLRKVVLKEECLQQQKA